MLSNKFVRFFWIDDYFPPVFTVSIRGCIHFEALVFLQVAACFLISLASPELRSSEMASQGVKKNSSPTTLLFRPLPWSKTVWCSSRHLCILRKVRCSTEYWSIGSQFQELQIQPGRKPRSGRPSDWVLTVRFSWTGECLRGTKCGEESLYTARRSSPTEKER